MTWPMPLALAFDQPTRVMWMWWGVLGWDNFETGEGLPNHI